MKHNHSTLTQTTKMKKLRHLHEIKLNFLTIFQTFCPQSGINVYNHVLTKCNAKLQLQITTDQWVPGSAVILGLFKDAITG